MKRCAESRQVWNVALEQFTSSQRVDINMWDRQLSEARAEFDWLRAGSSSVQRGALCDLRKRGGLRELSDFFCQSCGLKTNADVNVVVNITTAVFAAARRGGTLQQRPDEMSTLNVT